MFNAKSALSRWLKFCSSTLDTIGFSLSTNPTLAGASILCMVVGGFIPTAAAFVAGFLIDVISTAGRAGVFARATELKVVGLVGAEAALTILGSILGKLASTANLLHLMRQRDHLRTLLVEKMMSLSLEQVEESECKSTYALASTRGISHGNLIVQDVAATLQAVSSTGGAIVLMTHFSMLGGVLILLCTLPSFIIGSRLTASLFKTNAQTNDALIKSQYLNSVLTDDAHAKEARIYDFKTTIFPTFKKTQSETTRQFAEQAYARLFLTGMTDSLGTISIYVIYGTSAISAANGGISIGHLALLLMLSRQIQGALASGLESINSLYSNVLNFSSFFAFINIPRTKPRGERHAGDRPGDGIRFIDVCYRYKNAPKPSLVDISLHIRPGKSLAVVGENGAGKSTLIKLLMGLYVPTNGTITLDGTPIGEWDEAALRRRMSVLFQDFGRYQLLAGETIGLGDSHAFSDQSRWQAAAFAGAANEMIEKLPKKFHTQLGKQFAGGQDLSGGEWQRIALARAHMAREADIVVFDEPTSALDALTEERIFDQFWLSRGHKTIVLVSHKLSAVKNADCIIVMKHGVVVEEGSHQGLLRANGRYAEMYFSQASGYE